ncbi:hypothetical protein SAMD00019534_072480 [Acytostelium subglobosum LB1]|uniref:hypothetical protein n=1 Tax=Acytostelium subglobosum LB1 TaxID=1410327 RepID=UPI0006451BC8|nr:hypothetical protein SAMD00019534_072480 [Acytostelium subglobosum LB1]GAM24073.1 hypothetical protein SAMD00019534_072480 [Acytostelium subglobosum LB1]|eukprot:XP_012753109.1 hypothetical protein SAMD00019534_072480 [Acytostelium subglobosum LB1]
MVVKLLSSSLRFEFINYMSPSYKGLLRLAAFQGKRYKGTYDRSIEIQSCSVLTSPYSLVQLKYLVHAEFGPLFPWGKQHEQAYKQITTGALQSLQSFCLFGEITTLPPFIRKHSLKAAKGIAFSAQPSISNELSDKYLNESLSYLEKKPVVIDCLHVDFCEGMDVARNTEFLKRINTDWIDMHWFDFVDKVPSSTWLSLFQLKNLREVRITGLNIRNAQLLLQQPNIEQLKLSLNLLAEGLTDKDFKDFFGALKSNTTMRKLDLLDYYPSKRSPPSRFEPISAICDATSDLLQRNTSLRHLNFSRFTHVDERFFASLAANKTLTSLECAIVANNSADALCKSLLTNRTLSSLYIEDLFFKGDLTKLEKSIAALLSDPAHNLLHLNTRMQFDGSHLVKALTSPTNHLLNITLRRAVAEEFKGKDHSPTMIHTQVED